MVTRVSQGTAHWPPVPSLTQRELSMKFVLTRIHEPTTGHKGIYVRDVIVGTVHPRSTPAIKVVAKSGHNLSRGRKYVHVKKCKGTNPRF